MNNVFKLFFHLFGVIFFSFSFQALATEYVSICERTDLIERQIKKEITELRGETGLPEQIDCETVTRDELSSIKSLVAYGKSGKRVRRLHPSDFKHLIGLEYLDLGEHLIQVLPDGIFSDLISLRVLNLSNNQIRDLSDELHPLTVLRELFLYGNQLKHSISATQGKNVFSGNIVLERVVLSYNGLESLPSGLFIRNPGLKVLTLSYNKIEKLPASMFHRWARAAELDFRYNRLTLQDVLQIHQWSNGLRSARYEYVDLVGNQIKQSEYVRVWSALGYGRAVLTVGALKVPRRGSTGSKLMAEAADRVTQMTIRYWGLPFQFSVVFPEMVAGFRIDGLMRAILEKVAVRELMEAKGAYRTTPFDFYKVRVHFRDPLTKDVDAHLNEKYVDVVEAGGVVLTMELPISAKPHDKTPSDRIGESVISPKFFVHTGDMLAALSKTFSWDRKHRWYDAYSGEGKWGFVQRALDRDLRKVEKLRQILDSDIIRLEILNAKAMKRSKIEGKIMAFSQDDIQFARFRQFSIMFTLQRLLNTLARWRPVFHDKRWDADFPMKRKVRMVLTAASSTFQAYLGAFIRVITDDDSRLHRNPLYKMLNEKLPDSRYLFDGRRSIELPEGSIVGLLFMRQDKGLYKWFAEIIAQNLSDSVSSSRKPKVNDRPETSAMYATHMSQALLGIKKYRLSSVRAKLLSTESKIKDALEGAFFKVVEKVGTWSGDTRVFHPDAAISDEQLDELEEILEPGDIILVRKDYYVSNIALPGFWPHAILYLGDPAEWLDYKIGEYARLTKAECKRLGFPYGAKLRDISALRGKIAKYVRGYHSKKHYRVIESVSEGVLFNSIHGAMHKDYLAVIRPIFSSKKEREHSIARAFYNAIRYEGSPYDFQFDFRTDQMVCTEVAAYQPWDWYVRFSAQLYAPEDEKPEPRVPGLIETAGRPTMPADEIAKLSDYMRHHPDSIKASDGTVIYPGPRLKLIKLILKIDDYSDGRYYATEYTGEEAHRKLHEVLEE